MWEIFIEYQLYPTYICELITAVAGIIYLKTNRIIRIDDRLLVYYFVFIFVFDLFAISYGLYGHVYDFKYLEFVRGTPFESHFWIYNILTIITTTAFTSYFVLQLESSGWKKIILGVTGVFIITTIISYFQNDVFFVATSPYAFIFGAFLISFAIGIFYLELISSDRILNFRSYLALYISIGLLVYKLSITPLFIFQSYIGISEDFRIVYNWVLKAGNIFMYSVFTFGFIKKLFELKTIKA